MAKKFCKTVKFGGLSIGEETARLGFHLDRGDLDILEADGMFAGSRCQARIEADDSGDQQELAIGGKSFKGKESIDCVADIRRYGVNADTITAGLALKLSEINVSKLALFANRTGKLTLKRTGDIPADASAQGELLDEAADLAEDQDAIEPPVRRREKATA